MVKKHLGARQGAAALPSTTFWNRNLMSFSLLVFVSALCYQTTDDALYYRLLWRVTLQLHSFVS